MNLALLLHGEGLTGTTPLHSGDKGKDFGHDGKVKIISLNIHWAIQVLSKLILFYLRPQRDEILVRSSKDPGSMLQVTVCIFEAH